jgi:protein gp37
MGINTAISWCDHTVNFWTGCAKVNDECRFCYAEAISERYSAFGRWGTNGTRVLVKSAEANLRKIARIADQTGRQQYVFVNSLADTYEGEETGKNSWNVISEGRARIWKAIEDHPEITFLLLTKRPENIGKLTPGWVFDKGNVWFGVSAGTRASLERASVWLRDLPATATFLSMEPLLEDVVVYDPDKEPLRYVDWVIVGGESGPNARPMQAAWAEHIRLACQEYGIPFFFKQMGGRGKAKGGHLLNGQVHQQTPWGED